METAGIVVGAASLASLFCTCFDIYDKIKALRGAANDLRDIRSRLDLEVRKLRFVQKKCNSGTLDKDAEDIMILAQKDINERLKEIQSTIHKYSLGESESTQSSGTSLLRPKDVKFTKSSRKVLKWIASDKEFLEEQLIRLQNLFETIWYLATTVSERVREDYILRADAISTPDASLLTTVATMPAQQYPGIVKAARVKQLLSQCTEDASVSLNSTYSEPKFLLPLTSMQWHSRSLKEAMCEPWSLGICEKSGIGVSEVPVIVEWRGPPMRRNSATLVEKRLDNLCELLRAMHTVDAESNFSYMDQYSRNVDFGMLKCVGWTRSSESFDSVALVFQYPYEENWRPESLRSKILAMRAGKKKPPSLGDRFDLAFGICNAVANIISIGWMHRAIRSDNMLIFDRHSIRKVFLVGFTYARPGVFDEEDSAQELSNLPNSRSFALYRPSPDPDGEYDFAMSSGDEDGGATGLSNQASNIRPSISPRSAVYDLYGLGIVLLEIGLWDTVENMKDRRKSSSIQEFQARGIKEPLAQLSSRCGDIYRDVVERCLTPIHWQREMLMENLGDIVGSLRSCRA
ncbi:uncharacterized protein PAC_10169 [Phialocephala subalpina]|uniref:Prion-inhibition and propagation HeLo domain-containing protein n=1 Tax=Phialocephala subalpina TaxID=576137 RepID=A0A1L7X5I1_9HELO|nr:uncharacterized protein PAC_10169 [Phialocephala subalpina]